MVDIKRRENDMLEAIGTLCGRRDMTLMQLQLFEYAYPHMGSVWDALRACLKGADE